MNKASLRIKEGQNTTEDMRRLAQEWVKDNQEQFDRWIEEAKGEGIVDSVNSETSRGDKEG
ncbi:hypothetical protein [Roseofilum sp. Guam]|uniref:hypothetical protein n=1 Tax=Roseofilum sp. Guam TaxID=2821502 RepID=UPI001B082D13|nr:hypothetical protein [Roseofilum sp. Guam]MBP0031383.1 hypothetical protein [Roseofilum sp. Guam]